MSFLEIKNLSVEIDGKKILDNLNLNVQKGEVCVLMGPNGSGKTTLSKTLMGHPKCKITSGEILFNGEDIIKIPVNEKAKKGLFLSFQYPQEISGVTISNFLRTAYNAVKEKKLPPSEFLKLVEEKTSILSMDRKFLSRYLNEGFSGGEKKKAEILQMLFLNPKIAILDETDSGLDIDSLRIVANGIKNFMNKEKAILLITHYKRILDYIKPDKVFVMKNGRIVQQGGGELIQEIEEKGYEGLK
ncbi:MAG: Fe-S cluster assembly ATPase SufC [Nanoarchaeota archaeon]